MDYNTNELMLVYICICLQVCVKLRGKLERAFQRGELDALAVDVLVYWYKNTAEVVSGRYSTLVKL